MLLYRHYGCDPKLTMYLLDRTAREKRVFYGFADNACFYNSLEVAERVLLNNGVARQNLCLLEATADHRIEIGSEIDLAISLISWGFHYPVSTYLNRVHSILSGNGRLIIDIRKGTGGERELGKRFAKIELVSETEKKIRVTAYK